jgi:hypothetical protein
MKQGEGEGIPIQDTTGKLGSLFCFVYSIQEFLNLTHRFLFFSRYDFFDIFY